MELLEGTWLVSFKETRSGDTAAIVGARVGDSVVSPFGESVVFVVGVVVAF